MKETTVPTPPKPTFHQSGILNRPPEHNLLAALAFAGPAASDPTAARTTLEALRRVVHAELRSDLDDQDPMTPCPGGATDPSSSRGPSSTTQRQVHRRQI